MKDYLKMCVNVGNWQESNLEYFTNQMLDIYDKIMAGEFFFIAPYIRLSVLVLCQRNDLLRDFVI